MHNIICKSVNKNGTWYRTEVDPDGNCFYNAYAYSLEPNEYSVLDIFNRKKRVLEIKSFISNKITYNDILQLRDPLLFENMLSVFEKYDELYKYESINLSKQNLLSIEEYLELVYLKYPEKRTSEEYQYVVTHIINNVLENIRSYIKEDGKWVNDSIIPLLMKKLNIHIHIISHDTQQYIKHHPIYPSNYCIIMYHQNNHFESVGYCENNIMKRVFSLPFPEFP